MRLVLGVSLAIVLAGLTHAETARWQNDRTLWCAAMTLAPDKPRALNNCALALIRAGEYEAALPLLARAAWQIEQREPNRRAALRVTIRTNQFLALYALRRDEEARQTLATVDQADPRVIRFQQWMRPTLQP